MVLWLREFGLTKYHLTNVIHRHTSLSLREVLKEHDLSTNSHAKVLMLKPLVAGFGLLLTGLFVSTVVFIHELKKKHPGLSMINIFRVIRDDRKCKNEIISIKNELVKRKIIKIKEILEYLDKQDELNG